MALQSDENGFLVGQAVQDLKRVSKGIDVIRKDVHEIKKLLGMKPNDKHPRPVNPPSNSSNANTGSGQNNGNNGNNQSSGNSGQSTPPTPSQSQNSGNSSLNAGNNDTLNAGSSNSSTPPVNTAPPPSQSETIDAGNDRPQRARDANGRFTSENNQDTIDATPNGGRARNANGRFTDNGLDKDTKDGGNESGLSDMFDGLGDRITTALNTDGLEEIDPTVKAFQETVEPLKRGWQFLMSGSDKKDKPYFAWFSKIWKTLKKTEENTEEKQGGGGSLLMTILGLVAAATAALTLFKNDKGESLLTQGVNYVKESSGYNAAVDWTSNNVIEPIMSVLNPLIASWAAIFTNIGTAWDLFIASITAKWNIISAVVSETFKIFSTAITGSWDKVVSIGSATFDYVGKSINSFLSEALSNIVGFISDLMSGLSSFLKDKFGIDISANVSGLANKAAEMKQSASNTAIEAQNSKQALGDKVTAFTQPITDQVAIAKQNIAEITERENKVVSEAADKNSKATEKTAEAMGNYTNALIDLGGKIGGGVMDSVIGTANASEKPYSGDASVGNHAKVSGSEVDMALAFKGGGQLTGLSDIQTRALAANTAKTESGGKLDSNNKQGYFGQYQFGAEAMQEAGLLNVSPEQIKSAKKSSGKNWYKKGASGQEAFLRDKSNWNIEGGLDNFLNNKELQDKAYIAYTNKNISGGIRSGAITANDDAGKIAGYSKAAHLKGVGGANKLFNQGMASVDGNGTSTATYARQASNAMNSTVSAINVRMAEKPTITPEQINAAMPKSQATTMPTQTVSQAAPVMPVMPKMPTQTEAPPIITPLASDAKAMPQPVMVSEIGQNLPDSTIARIASPYQGFKGG